MLLLLASLAFAQSAAPVGGDDLYTMLGAAADDYGPARLTYEKDLVKLDNSYSDLGAEGAGVCLAVRDGWVSRIYLTTYAGGNGDCPGGRFDGELPFGLSWGMSKAAVEATLGEPFTDDVWGTYWSDHAGGFVHADYDSGALQMLEIGYDGWVPTAVTKWFQDHPRASKGKLATGGLVTALAQRNGATAAEPVEDLGGDEGEISLEDLLPAEPAVAAPPPPPKAGKKAKAASAPKADPAPKPARQPREKPVATKKPSAPTFPSIDNPARTGSRASGETAVIIGLEQYPFLSAGVPFAKRDAQAFDDLLVYTRGVPQQKIQSLSSGAREQMLAAIQRAANEAGNGGTVWVYFAGHGAANPQTGERMLLGDDVRSDAVAFASRGVGVSEIEKVVTAAGARPLLVLDTCFAGASRSGASIIGGTRLVVPAYAIATMSDGAAQWNAASPDQISGPLPGVEHGAFTYYAVGALRGWADGELDGKRDGQVTASEAQAYVTRALRRSGRNDQQPVYVGPDDLVLSSGVTETGPGF